MGGATGLPVIIQNFLAVPLPLGPPCHEQHEGENYAPTALASLTVFILKNK